MINCNFPMEFISIINTIGYIVNHIIHCKTNIHSLIVTTGTVMTDEGTRTRAGGSACSSVV